MTQQMNRMAGKVDLGRRKRRSRVKRKLNKRRQNRKPSGIANFLFYTECYIYGLGYACSQFRSVVLDDSTLLMACSWDSVPTKLEQDHINSEDKMSFHHDLIR